jgi:hypothetical protein
VASLSSPYSRTGVASLSVLIRPWAPVFTRTRLKRTSAVRYRASLSSQLCQTVTRPSPTHNKVISSVGVRLYLSATPGACHCGNKPHLRTRASRRRVTCATYLLAMSPAWLKGPEWPNASRRAATYCRAASHSQSSPPARSSLSQSCVPRGPCSTGRSGVEALSSWAARSHQPLRPAYCIPLRD